jgi:CheY-like chemotaxis protein
MASVNRDRPGEILLVEDSPDDAEQMIEALENEMLDHRVSLIEDGEQAVDYLRRSPTPDLLVLDLHLPRCDGEEILEEMARDPRLRRIPVVVLTTLGNDKVLRKLDELQLHKHCCVSKPIDSEQSAQAAKRIKHFWLNNGNGRQDGA